MTSKACLADTTNNRRVGIIVSIAFFFNVAARPSALLPSSHVKRQGILSESRAGI